ncbi:MAG: sigma-54-dependent Fis family transcriptional regulator, partial [Bacteroidaceae bacterium]|nr:sigma-54-dependent Fis family transcriptional regulator [Bacteroidaceae bacterium]
LATAVLVAPTDLSVLIQGESGVGKEVIPRIIHDHSQRRGKTYIAINCGAIPEGTIDSELFGHEKGAFTSAIGEHEGFFGAANGGTLFLDEVGELPLSTQARLLRVLETGEYLRVGSSTPRKTNVRIVAATNVDIPTAIKQGRFREDLYYRLSTINIQIPPLRKRQGDAVLLFKKFALDTASRYNIPEPIRLTPEAETVVNSYKWPGNIRQLRNITEQLSILSESRSVTPEMLAKLGITPNSDDDTGIATVGGSTSGGQHDYEQEIKILAHAVFELRSDVQELKEKLQGHNWHEAPASTTLPVPVSQQKKVQHTQPEELDISTAEEIVDDGTLNIGDMEKRNILLALQRNHYKRKLAAEELGISERTLYRKIKAYGIDE